MTTKIIAYYGFKGGAGRSFLLANTAALLAAAGRKVLVIDLDLEAPGVGDFFDTPASPDRPGTPLASQWRQREGFLDLISRLRRPPQESQEQFDRGFESKLDKVLEPGKGATSETRPFLLRVFERPGEGQLWLMGPGSHELSAVDGSFSYVLKTLQLDWQTLLNDGEGQVILGGLKNYFLRRSPYTHVLIDGRTGYNPASLVAIKNLATDVVIVGTESLQSIDGVARMRPLFENSDSDVPETTCHLVITKSGAQPNTEDLPRRKVERLTKAALNEIYHPKPRRIWQFPFVEDLVTGDSLIFQRQGLRDDKFGYLEVLRMFASGFTEVELTRDHLNNAFDHWAGAKLTKLASEFEGPSTDRREQEELSARDKRLQSYREARDKLLKSDFKPAAPRANAVMAGEQELQRGAGALVKEAFERLTAEERALVCAETAQELEVSERDPSPDTKMDPSAVRELRKWIPLSILPNVVNHFQLRALRIGEDEQSSLDGRRATQRLQPIGATADQRRVIRRLSSQVIKGDEVPHNSDNDGTEYAQMRTVLSAVSKRDRDRCYSADSIRLLSDLIANKNLFLPEADELPQSNVLDVFRLALGVMPSGRDHEWSSAATELCREVIRYLSKKCADKYALREPAAQRQFTTDIRAWVSLWTKAALRGPSFRDYPTWRELEPGAELLTQIAAEQGSLPTARLNTLGAMCLLQLEGEHRNDAEESFASALALARQLDPWDLSEAEGRESREAIVSLRAVARMLDRVKEVWELDRRSKRFEPRVPRGSSSLSSAYSAAETWISLLSLGLEDAEFTMPDKAGAEGKYRESISWFGETGSLRRGFIAKFVDNENLHKQARSESSSYLHSWLASAYAERNEIAKAREYFDKAKDDSPVENKRDYLDIIVGTSNEILRTLALTGDWAAFDRWLNETDILTGKESIDPFMQRIRTILRCQRRAASGPTQREQAASEAEAALAAIFEDYRRGPHPGDRDFCDTIGAEWDGLGAFSGDEYPSYRRAVLANLILDVAELKGPPVTTGNIASDLVQVERLIWKTIRPEGATIADSEVFAPIRLALSLPRARLEWRRHELGMSADVSRALAEMKVDCDENGSGRLVFYPKGLRQRQDTRNIIE